MLQNYDELLWIAYCIQTCNTLSIFCIIELSIVLWWGLPAAINIMWYTIKRVTLNISNLQRYSIDTQLCGMKWRRSMPPMTSLCLNELHTCNMVWKRQSIWKCRSPLSASTAVYLRTSLTAQFALYRVIPQSHQGPKVRDRSGKLAQTQHCQTQTEAGWSTASSDVPTNGVAEAGKVYAFHIIWRMVTRQALGSQASAHMASTTALSQLYSYQPASTNRCRVTAWQLCNQSVTDRTVNNVDRSVFIIVLRNIACWNSVNIVHG